MKIKAVLIDCWLTLIDFYLFGRQACLTVGRKNRESIFHDILEVYDNSLLLIDLKVREYSQELLSYLKDKGYKIGLVSNTSHGHVLRKILQEFGLSQYFDTMVFSDELGLRKPQPDIFNEALKLLPVPACSADRRQAGRQSI